MLKPLKSVKPVTRMSLGFLVVMAVCAWSANQWSSDMDASRALAQKQGKPVFLYIYNDPSVDSKLVVKNSLTDPEVNKLLANRYVLARCDVNSASWFIPIIKDIGLYRFKLPLIMVINPDKGVKSFHEGYITAESLAWFLASNAGLKPKLKTTGQPTDESLYQEGKKAYDAKDWDTAAKAFNRVTESKLGIDDQWKLNFYLGVLYYVNGDYDAAIARYKRANEIKDQADTWFNMGCAFARETDISSSLFSLEKAMQSGYKDFSSLRTDEDLGGIQGPGLEALIARYSGGKPAKVKAKPEDQKALVMSQMEAKCFDLVNAMRTEKGLKPLVFAPDLLVVTRKHSADMGARNFFDHVNPDGKSPFDRIKAAGIGYDYAAENIQYSQGFDDPATCAADGWRNSPGHYHNIMTPELSESAIGLGVTSDGKYFFTQVFIRRQ